MFSAEDDDAKASQLSVSLCDLVTPSAVSVELFVIE